MEISKLGDSVNRVAFGDSSSRLERTMQSIRDSESSKPVRVEPGGGSIGL